MRETGISIGVILLAWESACHLFSIPSFLLPPPSMIVVAAWTSKLLRAASLTTAHALGGFALANLVGVMAALLFTYSDRVRRYGFVVGTLVKMTPFVAIASILYIVFGTSPFLPVLLVGMATFFPIVSNLDTGLREVPETLLARMTVLNATPWQTFRHVRWPNALPHYFAAYRISLTSAIIVALVAEWLVGHRGLGYLILQAMTQFRADRLWAATWASLILGTIALAVVGTLERRVLKWRK